MPDARDARTQVRVRQMPSRSLRLILALALVGSSGVALSVPAAAADRCEGTFCDFYYEHVAPPKPVVPPAPAPKAPAATPQAATAPATPRRLVGVQGGGLIGMMNGTAPKRCTGTLCDLFYGGPPPEEPAVPPEDAAVAAEPASEEAAVPSRPNRIEAPSEAETRPGCVADTRDPWRCYRR